MRAGVKAAELIEQMSRGWLEEARARAAQQVRAIDATAADPAHDREAQRVMEIAATRYHHHYLTERAQNYLRLGPELVGILLDNGGAMHLAAGLGLPIVVKLVQQMNGAIEFLSPIPGKSEGFEVRVSL